MAQDGGARRDSFAEYRDLLAAKGFTPSRRLGQNFLLDPSLHRVLVDAVSPEEGDLVLEVGAGLGFLTRELSARRCRVLAVEVDARLVEVLASEVSGYPEGGRGVRLLHADVLSRSRIAPEVLAAVSEERARASGRFLLVANLPYAIAAPLLGELSALGNPPDEMAILVQLELAQRLMASPGTKEYGALSVQVQLGFDPLLLRKVGAQVFRPRPRVDSAMVHLRPRPGAARDRTGEERAAMAHFWRRLFASRRKKLRNAVVLAGETLTEVSPALLDQRPGDLSPDQLVELWDRLRPNSP